MFIIVINNLQIIDLVIKVEMEVDKRKAPVKDEKSF